ncbi:MAG: helix-turn-helix domain-containing protein [Firmicutes bacterium]|nr:helix-turn-helix domain-containing protein [Bacillota bacterium]
MTLGEKINILRKDKQISTRLLGAVAGVSSSMISKWERNVCEPKVYSIQKLADYFDITLEELLDNEIDI